MATYQWDVQLRPNALTKDDLNDCIAEVLTRQQTRHNADIADRIVARGSEFRKETIVAILSQRDEEVLKTVLEGSSFADSLVQVSPRVSGVWATSKAPFDAAVHRRTVDLTLTAAFRAALEAVGVRVLGTKASGAEIALITDTATGATDGTITIGDDIIIEGDKLKVDEADDGQGVFIVDADGTEHKVTRRLSLNKPSQLIARVPAAVPAGSVTVLVRTKYSSGAKLANLREITYSRPCTAVQG